MKNNLMPFRIVLLVALASVLMSCQRVIDVNVGNAQPQLVIEGNLTDVQGTQTVTLSQSVSYNSANVFPTVSGATVSISDAGGGVHKFTETKAGTYTITNFKGTALNAYTLNVKLSGQTYTGTSVMPFPVNLDSLTLVSQGLGNKNVITVVVNYQDPAATPNQYRFIMYVNGVQIKHVFVQNDQFSDGRAVSAMLYEGDVTLNPGDKVDVDMECVDAAMYNYWNSLSNQGGNTPDDSATPSNPPSNLSPSVLGYFSAHTIQRKTIIIP